MRRAIKRTAALSIATLLLACSCQTTPQSLKQLATDQTLRVPIRAEPRAGGTSLDPARIVGPVETTIGQNIFSGLYRYDDQMREQADIADGMPMVSSDGKIYTFRLRHDVRFWNGERVTADDVVYSWNRAAAAQGDWAASVFHPIVGYDAVAGAGVSRLAGLSTPDPYTVVAQLSAPSGYWLATLVLPAAWVVNRTAIEQGGPERWWTNPDGLVGTGPFRLTSWTHNGELDFAAVPNWWDGGTGTLKRVELHVDPDPGTRWKGYADGRYDLLEVPNLASTETADLAAWRSDPGRRSEVHTWAFGTTSWIGFNLQSGPFAGFDQGTLLRKAFSQAIDRQKLAQAVCQGGTICVPATGGLVAKGLHGYLGDGADPTAKFDPAVARATVKRLDPDGSLVRNLSFYYTIGTDDPGQVVAENLAAQWSANLGVNVAIKGLDPNTYFNDLTNGRFTMWRGGWQADYDHPQDWFDFLFINNSGCGQAFCNSAGAIYDRPGYAARIASADQQPLADALPAYLNAGQMLVNDAALGVLYYVVRTAVVKPYVNGYGANALWENRWTSIRILQH